MSSAKRTLPAVVAAAVVALAAAGCGGAASVGADRTLPVALSDYRVTPQDVDAATGLLTFDVHNYGRLTHDLVVSLGGQVMIASKPIAPGQGEQLVTALAPGSYQMTSSILSDQALGAYGTLTVR